MNGMFSRLHPPSLFYFSQHFCYSSRLKRVLARTYSNCWMDDHSYDPPLALFLHLHNTRSACLSTMPLQKLPCSNECSFRRVRCCFNLFNIERCASPTLCNVALHRTMKIYPIPPFVVSRAGFSNGSGVRWRWRSEPSVVSPLI